MQATFSSLHLLFDFQCGYRIFSGMTPPMSGLMVDETMMRGWPIDNPQGILQMHYKSIPT